MRKKLTVGVAHGDDLLVVIEVVEERSEDSPTGIKLVITDEVGVVTLQGVENKRFVGLGNLQVREAAAVGEIQLGNHGLHAQARELRVHLNVHALVGLDADNKLVAGNVLENARGDVLELDTDLGLLLVEGLAGLEDERNTIPSLVLDVGNHRGEGGAAGSLGNGLVVLVRGLGSVERLLILTDDNVLGLDGRHAAEDADLLVTDVLSRERDGTLHCEQGQDLEKMVLHNITDDAELVEVTASALSAERLLEGDLDGVSQL
jgi:hypothetical protein